MALFLHLPFLLSKDGQLVQSHSACMNASRSILERFLVYRQEYVWQGAGRQVDYSALISAMTLCLGHITGPTSERQADRDMVEKTLIKFRELASYKRDRLSAESAETINQLLPILAAEGHELLTLNIPFLGTITIAPRSANRGTDFPTPVQGQTGMVDGPDADQITGMNIFAWSGNDPVMPEVEDWPFQGIDTTYWSTLNPSV
jgi:hypothetical protein